ncbi:Threonine dehydrogenase [Rubellimicrobium mesophilum DSM 19309]|uniref:Threonine dehydrogenase n=1 Tax=Rubellimicrobium mesophilum DSM 19309 TaxID=442562 RepID=A0A017HV98_9RHOB|nr:zinc-binding dehydrogenase [Rubellimicrobium mesophilum]EYD78260.1 Threonine dehydrogenase [Rubellimicrobium mesophilum DSM 19309]
MSAGMRAARIVGPGQVEVVDLALPEPGPGELRVRLEGCGVCASNLEPWAGPDWMQFPTEPGGLGHEGWGVVDAVGDGVQGLAPGDRVAVLNQHGYATHDVVRAEQAVRLPPGLAGVPFPGEAFGCAVNIARRSRIEPGQTVAVIGIGFIGAAVTRLAAQAGATVIAISRRDSSLALAREMGAAHTIPMQDHWGIIEEVRRVTDGRMCDVVVEAVGKEWPLNLAGDIVAEGGRLVIAGYHQDGSRTLNIGGWNWRGLDIVNAHERDPQVNLRGLREAVEAAASGRIAPPAAGHPPLSPGAARRGAERHAGQAGRLREGLDRLRLRAESPRAERLGQGRIVARAASAKLRPSGPPPFPLAPSTG